jgi:hypothetical protein
MTLFEQFEYSPVDRKLFCELQLYSKVSWPRWSLKPNTLARTLSEIELTAGLLDVFSGDSEELNPS